MAIDTAKLAKMQSAAAASRVGGKGTPRRKVKRAPTSTVADDKKIQATMKKLHAQPIPGIEVVNMFKEDGKVINIPAPNIQAAIQCNAFSIFGNAQEKELTELIPDILHQLGPDSISSIKRLAESFQQKGTLPSSFDEAVSGVEI